MSDPSFTPGPTSSTRPNDMIRTSETRSSRLQPKNRMGGDRYHPRRLFHSIFAPCTKDHRQCETQPLLRHQRGRLRNGVRALYHRECGVIEGGVAGTAYDTRRLNMSCSVECEADEDLNRLCRPVGGIALVPIEMGDQLLLPRRPDTLRAFARSLHGCHGFICLADCF